MAGYSLSAIKNPRQSRGFISVAGRFPLSVTPFSPYIDPGPSVSQTLSGCSDCSPRFFPNVGISLCDEACSRDL
jgi:hypothetical protein